MKRVAQCGSVLISVLVALVILVAISRMLTLQQSERVELLSMEDNRQASEYLAEAGLRHALWHVRGLSNSNYPAEVSGSLPGQGTYRATITPTSGTPITVTSSGTTPTGAVARVTAKYDVQCAGKIITTAVINAYDSKGTPTTIFQSGGGNSVVGFLPVNNSPSNGNSAHSLIKFDLTSLPKNIVYESADLLLDVHQHDSTMEGGTLFVNRLIKAYDVSRVSWTDTVSTRDKWATPGGDYSIVDEAQAIIAASVLTYTWKITPIVHAWVNGTLLNNGLIVRTDRPSSEIGHKLRLKKNTGQWPSGQWPRLVVKYCN